jgi:hypothetical protein
MPELGVLPGIPGSESDKLAVKPAQEHARSVCVRMLEYVTIKLFPLGDFRIPVFLIRFEQRRLALLQHGCDKPRLAIR